MLVNKECHLYSQTLFQLNKDVTSFQRNFVDDVRRCHEMERKLRYIESELENHGVTISPCSENVKALPPNEIADLEVQTHFLIFSTDNSSLAKHLQE